MIIAVVEWLRGGGDGGGDSGVVVMMVMVMVTVMMMTMIIQFDNGGGVGVGVIVTVVCSTESRDAERLPTRSRVTASLSGSAPPAIPPPAVPAPARAPVPAPRLPVLDVVATAPTVSSALLPAHCTAPPRPTVTDSHFCLPLFFFLRLKKQQHLVSSIMSTS